MRDADAVAEVVTVVEIPVALVPKGVVVHGILVYGSVDFPVAMAPGRADAEAGANGCVGFDGVDSDGVLAVAEAAAVEDDCDDYCGGCYCSEVIFDDPKWPVEID